MSSTLSDALTDFDREASETVQRRCMSAIGDAVLFLCTASSPGVVLTGHEPAHRLMKVARRRFVVSEVAGVGCVLFAFSCRSVAEEWCRRVAGFSAEPLDGPAVVDTAMMLGCDGVVVDPGGAKLFVSRRAIEWGGCSRRKLGQIDLADALMKTVEESSHPATEQCATALRDAVLFTYVEDTTRRTLWSRLSGRRPGFEHFASVHGHDLPLVRLEDGEAMLIANTDRSFVEDTCRSGHSRCLAMDGPGMVELANLTGANLGFMVKEAITLRLGPDWLARFPRRPLSATDF
jgi:hypothetical protein